MTTKKFIKTYCIGTWCPDFDTLWGCHAYDGEECDKAFCHKLWHGKTMRQRIDEYCEKHMREKKLGKHVERS